MKIMKVKDIYIANMCNIYKALI